MLSSMSFFHFALSRSHLFSFSHFYASDLCLYLFTVRLDLTRRDSTIRLGLLVSLSVLLEHMYLLYSPGLSVYLYLRIFPSLGSASAVAIKKEKEK